MDTALAAVLCFSSFAATRTSDVCPSSAHSTPTPHSAAGRFAFANCGMSAFHAWLGSVFHFSWNGGGGGAGRSGMFNSGPWLKECSSISNTMLLIAASEDLREPLLASSSQVSRLIFHYSERASTHLCPAMEWNNLRLLVHQKWKPDVFAVALLDIVFYLGACASARFTASLRWRFDVTVVFRLRGYEVSTQIHWKPPNKNNCFRANAFGFGATKKTEKQNPPSSFPSQ